MKTYEELKHILYTLRNQPSEELRKNLDCLKLKFYEWSVITGNEMVFVDNHAKVTNKERAMLNNKQDILYSEFKDFISRPYTYEMPIKKGPQPMLEIWNEIKIKYDPINEMMELAQSILSAKYRHIAGSELYDMHVRLKQVERELLVIFEGDDYMIDIINRLMNKIENPTANKTFDSLSYDFELLKDEYKYKMKNRNASR